MIKLKKEYLTIIETATEQDHVSRDIFLSALLEKPSNIVYLETSGSELDCESSGSELDCESSAGEPDCESSGKLYGIITYGDVKKAVESDLPYIPVNRNFTSLGPDSYMEARRYFNEDSILSEIPIVENGMLIGEYDRFDTILFLERMRDWKYNRYAGQFLRGLGRIALVRPGKDRPSKQKIFDDWADRLTGYGADFSPVDLADLAGSEKNYDKILFVDDTELRGAKLFLELFDDYIMTFDVTQTYYEVCEKMGGTKIIDYEESLDFYRRQGVKVLTLTLNDTGSDYIKRIRRECAERYPDVSDNSLNKLMKQYDREFFDDLYEPEYARTLESGFFMVEKTRSTLRLMDTQSEYVNIENGERKTVGQPDDYTRTIFFYGACLPIGAYVSDEHTMESYLQAMLNEKGYKVRVVNYGSWGGNVACFGRMATSFIREGDIVVLLLEEFNMTGEDALNLWEPLEKNDVPSERLGHTPAEAEWLLDNPFHCNHHVMKCYAEAIFEKLFPEGYEDPEERLPAIRRQPGAVQQFYTDKYFFGWDAGGAKEICGCSINGNPFTNGHLHLIRTASEMMDHVILFSIQEKSDGFTFPERYAMAYDAAKQFSNVTVVPSGVFLSNVTLFPAYYAKVYEGDVREQAETHIETYAEVARLLGIGYRMVGEEPFDAVTNEINKAMISLMPGLGLKPLVIKRLELDGQVVSGSNARKLAEEKREEELARIIPPTTMKVLTGEAASEWAAE